MRQFRTQHTMLQTMKILTLPVAVVLLCMFSLYAVSPLTYDSIGMPADDACSGPGERTRIVKLYIVDVLLTAVLGEDDQDKEKNEASSEDHILLKKKRALLVSVLLLMGLIACRIAKRFDASLSLVGRRLGTAYQRTVHTCPNGYQFLHSGTSPPSI